MASVAGGVSWPLFSLFAANVWALEPLQAIRAVQGPSHLYTVVPSARARICKRLRSLGIDSASLCSLAGRYVILLVVLTRNATWAGGFDSLESSVLLKRSQIRALNSLGLFQLNFWNFGKNQTEMGRLRKNERLCFQQHA